MRTLRGVIIGLLIMLGAGGTFLYFETKAEQELQTVVNTANIEEIEKKIHDHINAVRASQGLNPLSYNTELVEIARAYSQQMAKEDFFSHYDPQGRHVADRYYAAGFTCGIRSGDYFYDGGENLSSLSVGKWISPFGSIIEYYTSDELSYRVVNGWMNSPGHRENILQDVWQSEGIGVAIADDGRMYVTENFC